MINDLVLVIIFATILATLFWKLKQPPILAYIITGILTGPHVFNLVTDSSMISVLSQLGIAFLLFMVGLELNFRKMKSVGFASLTAGIGQTIFIGLLGYFICLFLGFSVIHALYIAIALTNSSTIVIVKLLSEKNDLDSLYGRLAIGILLVQDFIAMLILIFISTIEFGTFGFGSIFETIIKGAVLFSAFIICSRYLLPVFFNSIVRSQELLFLSSISWCFIFSYFSFFLGFSIEIGAFLAGISLAPLPFYLEISGKVRYLRDFFIVLFFVLLGMQMAFSTQLLVPILILASVVLIGNPLIVMILLSLLGYRKRTSFFASLATAQISEFSLILIALGISLGHVIPAVASLVTSVCVVTIIISTYMITFNEQFYRMFSPLLSLFERKQVKEEVKIKKGLKNHIIIFGYHRIGHTITHALEKLSKNILVIDYDPELTKKLKQNGVPHVHGDATDSEVLEKINFKDSKIIISTIPNIEENLFLIREAKLFNIPVIVTAGQISEAKELYLAGADYVILPHLLGGERAATVLKDFIKNPNIIRKVKIQHLRHLEKRAEIGHEHKRYWE